MTVARSEDVVLIAELAARFCTSVWTIRRRVVQGEFPIAPLPRIDKRLRWSRAKVDAWFAAQAQPTRRTFGTHSTALR